MYKVDNYYSKKNSYSLDYLDPKLNLNLSKYIKQKITISDQDKKGLETRISSQIDQV